MLMRLTSVCRSRMFRVGTLPAVLWAVGSVVGCNNAPSRVAAPSWSPSSMSSAAIEQLDKSGDGEIDTTEVAAAPGLADAFVALDIDRSGTLSAEEIAARFELYERMRTASAFTTLVIKMNGRPLNGVFVKLVPEAFQGDSLSPAT